MRKIVTRVDIYKLREMCIHHNYYTRGDNEAYDKMLRKYNGNDEVSADDIYDLAEDIWLHSDREDTEATVETIAFNILQEATYHLIA